MNKSQFQPFLVVAPGKTIPPSLIDKFSSTINLFSSTSSLEPSPLQTSQAPYGALNEKSLGTTSGNTTSGWSGQEKFSLNLLSSPLIFTIIFPSESSLAVSIASVNRLKNSLLSALNTTLSTTTSI